MGTQKVSREEQLLQNAIQTFSRGGFRETSLQDLADQLGITRPLFYYYFESKENLLWRIIGHLGDSLLEQSRPIAEGTAPPLERLSRILGAHLQLLADNLDAFRVYYAERHLLKGKEDRRLKRGELLYHDLITDVIAEAQSRNEIPPGDPHLAARIAMGTANAILRWYVPSGPLSAEVVITETREFIIRGLTKPASSAETSATTANDS